MANIEQFIAILGFWWWLVALALLVTSSALSYYAKGLLSLVPGIGGITILFLFVSQAATSASTKLQGIASSLELNLIDIIPIMFYLVATVGLITNHFELARDKLKQGDKHENSRISHQQRNNSQ